MNISLEGKHALVCGGSKGIGFASACALADLGATITLVSRSQESLEKALAQLSRKTGQDHKYVIMDLSQPEQVREMMAVFAKTRTIEILINNAGGPKSGPIVDADLDQFLSGFATHVLSAQVMTQSVLPGMKQSAYGRIINIISTSVKQPIPGLGVSNTIRGAMGNWSKTMAGELAEFGITVNNILPGMTATERLSELFKTMADRKGITPEQHAEQVKATIPMKRFAAPEEIANAVAFLASPAASYITGTNVVVDGGRTMSL